MGVVYICLNIPAAFEQGEKENRYKGLTMTCEGAGYDYYRQIDRYPTDEEIGGLQLDCAAAAASCVWGSDTLTYNKAPLWAYKCEEDDDTTGN